MRMTPATLSVLDAFLAAGPNGQLYGLEIMRVADLRSGSLYPILDRLESAGWISGEWAQQGEDTGGRPRRRYYTLTGEGAEEARRAVRAASRPSQSGALRPVTS